MSRATLKLIIPLFLSNIAIAQQNDAWDLKPTYPKINRTIQKEITVACYDFYTPVNCYVEFELKGDDSGLDSGDHSHPASSNPDAVGKIEPSSGMAYASEGGLKAIYTAPERAGEVLLISKASYLGTMEKEYRINIRELDLFELANDPSSKYTLIGQTGGHPVNHYGSATLISAIKSVSEKYHEQLPGQDPLRVNDMSLKWGGLFDYKNNWQKPHASHRQGDDVDIDTVPNENIKTLELIAKMHGLTRVIEKGVTNHYHFRIQ